MAKLPIDIEFEMAGQWYPQAEALLDEHHLVAVAETEELRIQFGTHLVMQMEQMSDTEVCPLYGRFIHNLDELVYMLSRALPGRRVIEPKMDQIIKALGRKHEHTKRRYIVWHDAHRFAEREPKVFSEMVDCMMGVAAEQEYASEDTLLLTRCLFIGGPRLLEAEGFDSWLHEGEAQALWQVVSGLAKPPVRTVHIVSEHDHEDGAV